MPCAHWAFLRQRDYEVLLSSMARNDKFQYLWHRLFKDHLSYFRSFPYFLPFPTFSLSCHPHGLHFMLWGGAPVDRSLVGRPLENEKTDDVAQDDSTRLR